MLFPSDPKEVSIYRVNNGDDHGIRDCGCLPIASNCGCAAASPKIFCRASHSGAEYGMHPLSSLWYIDVYIYIVLSKNKKTWLNSLNMCVDHAILNF